MTRWMFPVLAVPLVIVALTITLLRPSDAHAQIPPTSYGPIAKMALTSISQNRGQCFLWVREVVKAAVGRTVGYDYHGGYLQAGAIEVPLLSAKDGDIIQVTNPANTKGDADYPGLHTAIVLDNLGNGKFRAIDSNSNYDGIVRIREQYNPAELSARYPGLVVRVYRIEGTPTPAATALPAVPKAAIVPTAPTFTATGTLPAPGATVTVAAEGDCLRVRSAAGLTGSVMGCLPTGGQATVTQVGAAADGYTWVKVSAGSVSGWVAANYLSPAVAVTSTNLAPANSPIASIPASPVVAAVAPPRGTFAAKPVYGAEGGQSASVFLGGSLDELLTAATDAKATGVWAQDIKGDFQLLIVGGPTFIIDQFRSRLSGFNGPTAVTLIGSAS